MLQAEENSHGRGLPIEQRPVFFAPTGMRVSLPFHHLSFIFLVRLLGYQPTDNTRSRGQSLLGGDEDEREARRLFRNELALGPSSDNAASSSRIVRRGYGGSRSLGRALHALAAPPPQDTMNARRVHFPARMGLESVSLVLFLSFFHACLLFFSFSLPFSCFSLFVHVCLFLSCLLITLLWLQRMEFLAALEMALEQYPVGLQLAHLDRDFNE